MASHPAKNERPTGDRDSDALAEIVRRIVRVTAGFREIKDAGR